MSQSFRPYYVRAEQPMLSPLAEIFFVFCLGLDSGLDTFDIVTLFFSQGLMRGICGSFFGMTGGYFIYRNLQTIPFAPGSTAANSGHLRISISSRIYIQACLLALSASGVASILLAREAGKITPIENDKDGCLKMGIIATHIVKKSDILQLRSILIFRLRSRTARSFLKPAAQDQGKVLSFIS